MKTIEKYQQDLIDYANMNYVFKFDSEKEYWITCKLLHLAGYKWVEGQSFIKTGRGFSYSDKNVMYLNLEHDTWCIGQYGLKNQLNRPSAITLKFTAEGYKDIPEDFLDDIAYKKKKIIKTPVEIDTILKENKPKLLDKFTLQFDSKYKWEFKDNLLKCYLDE